MLGCLRSAPVMNLLEKGPDLKHYVLGACGRTFRPARERDIFSSDKDGEAGDIE